jgi:hypothetical protein
LSIIGTIISIVVIGVRRKKLARKGEGKEQGQVQGQGHASKGIPATKGDTRLQVLHQDTDD